MNFSCFQNLIGFFLGLVDTPPKKSFKHGRKKSDSLQTCFLEYMLSIDLISVDGISKENHEFTTDFCGDKTCRICNAGGEV